VERDINVRPGGQLTLQPGVTLRWNLLLFYFIYPFILIWPSSVCISMRRAVTYISVFCQIFLKINCIEKFRTFKAHRHGQRHSTGDKVSLWNIGFWLSVDPANRLRGFCNKVYRNNEISYLLW
jgi:hypothetical protein